MSKASSFLSFTSKILFYVMSRISGGRDIIRSLMFLTKKTRNMLDEPEIPNEIDREQQSMSYIL